MCLILFAHQLHPELPLVVAANRDEHYGRATRAAGFWPDKPAILAGRDLEAGGTWLGISRSGRFAAVTNVREGGAKRPGQRSRGELTRDFLESDAKPLEYAREVLARSKDYSGFNLLVGDLDQLVYCENLRNSLQVVPPGLYGLSNHLLDTPWPKVVSGKNQLRGILESWHSAAEASSEQLFELLTDRSVAEDDLLPDTGVGLALERRLAPIFIEGETYGTCCSTVVVADNQGRVKFHERSFYKSPPANTVFEFRLDTDTATG
ncbi:NRDE family protein [Proteobacteria bacterium 005FR1]|nr:NRDE family protein [Proteobacteria bacterium 005FR1]